MTNLIIKWSGSEYPIEGLSPSDSVLDLKNLICKVTGVLPHRQKLLGLKLKGKPATDDAVFRDLNVKPGAKIMMMGTKEETIEEAVKPPEELPEVVDDFDVGDDEEVVAAKDCAIFQDKIAKRVKEYSIKKCHPPRPGKKLLVLDIDYTIFDHRSVGETGRDLMRPYLHYFLEAAYADYDIAIWSATSMKWIEAKLQELSLENSDKFKISFVLDSGAMITIDSPKYGVIEVKPLGVVWGQYEEYDESNTIMFDDMRRNFLMNPQNGLKIRPFRQAHLNRDKDQELFFLAVYLKHLAGFDDLTSFDHRAWEKCIDRGKKEDRH